MGIYDRAYLQEEDYGSAWAPGRSMVTTLIIINVLVWFLDIFSNNGQVEQFLALKSTVVKEPWMAWQLLTYGFAHNGGMHLLFNMLFLFFFGREMEGIYGRYEFLRYYLVAIVFSGMAWLAMNATNPNVSVVGASGGVMAVVILWVLHYPMRLIYIWGVIPVPGWLLGTFYVVGDLLGLLGSHDGVQPQVANIAHLAGAAFAFIYFRTKLNLGRFVPRRLRDLKPRLLKPKLRIHDPDKDTRDLNREVDAILEKISREGEASLSKRERKTLEEASRRYQRRRQP